MKSLVVHELLGRTVSLFGEKEIVSGTRRLTYRDFHERTCRLASSLKRLGIKKGTVVGVLDANTHRYLELHYALSMVGAVIHTLNFRLPGEDLVYTMVHAGDEWICLSDLFIQSVSPVVSRFKNWIIMSDDETLKIQGAEQCLSHEDLVRDGEFLDGQEKIEENDIYSIFYTTGTTGRPKGIRYRHRDILLGSLQLCHHLALHQTGGRIESSDVLMPLIPFFHIHGWGTVFFGPYMGSKMVLPGRATPSEQVELMKREGVTWLNMVPTQLHMLLEIEDFGNVKIVTGGSALPTGLARRALSRGVRYSLIYGGSDQLGASISVAPEGMTLGTEYSEVWELLRTRMRPIPMVDISIRDEGGNQLPHDGKTIGEIWVSSPWLPEGYYNDPERSREAYPPKHPGWFKTGDLGSFSPDGWLSVADRQKDAVKSGGEWIMTTVLEAILSEHPKVSIAAVIPVPDERWGERPLAIIKPRETVSETELRSFMEEKVLEGRIARFWIPDRFVLVEDIPITSAGKLNKELLRRSYR
ncbi:MAG: AMP-binding protein [Syntrophobacterales bacterium]|nr:AMP-binding protein [Syntrophobacterales bacterium]